MTVTNDCEGATDVILNPSPTRSFGLGVGFVQKVSVTSSVIKNGEIMQYLYSVERKGTAAHIWTGDDTACRMLSTGGIRMGKRVVHNELDERRVCLMCQNNAMKKEFLTKLFLD